MSASSKKKLRKEQNFVQLTEKQLAEQKEAKKLKINTIIFTVVILAVLVTGIVVMALSAFNSSGIAERNTTAMTVGEHKLTAAELNYFFMDGINNFYREWYNSYGDYAATYMMFMMGLDVTQPLDKQVYDEEAGTTFADYFSDAAVNSAVSAYSAYDLALEAGNQLTDADKETIELTMSSLTTNAMLGGYGSAEDYLKAMYGKGATEKTFRKYLEVINMSNAFLSQTYEGFTYESIVPVDAHITLQSQSDIHALFQMTPYYWKTPKSGAERLAALETLDCRISFRIHIFQKLQKKDGPQAVFFHPYSSGVSPFFLRPSFGSLGRRKDFFFTTRTTMTTTTAASSHHIQP